MNEIMSGKYAGQHQGAIIGADVRRKEIPEQIDRLHKTVTELEQVLGMLGERLQPVGYAKPVPEPVACPKEPSPNTQLATQVFEANSRLSSLVERVRYTLDELEI